MTSYLIDDRISLDYMKVRRITMAIFTGAGVAIVTPLMKMEVLIMIDLMN